MADALGITNADTSSKLRETYSPFLQQQAMVRPKLVAMLETTMAEFVSRSTASQKALPVMKSDDRRTAHELAPHYGITSISQDPEPKRNVLLLRSNWLEPRIPSPLLSESIRRRMGPSVPLP